MELYLKYGLLGAIYSADYLENWRETVNEVLAKSYAMSLNSAESLKSSESGHQKLSDVEDTDEHTKTGAGSSSNGLVEELDQLRKMNGAISSAIESVRSISGNIDKMIGNTSNANKLVDIWSQLVLQDEKITKMMQSKEAGGPWRSPRQFQGQIGERKKRLAQLKERYGKLKRRQKRVW